ncbi:50S ribosomal protein L24 [Temperatibacter marinus]|uniref:Large ribosomal subunit protein uL24 n=2 Tax=Temperatibacter marinus TaxID=1456591 RepID=A0AA52HAN2_9PROT|nr:50S ribosomal protein L24 [Temperatibacter marinus]WND02783.1 50S ribosomal protein L24 [Temperatibacter marinus]
MAAKLKTGDKVVVIAGKDKGKRGEITKMITSEGRAVVSGVNLIKKHNRPSQTNAGGIETKEAAIQLSNLMIEDPKDGAPTRVGFRSEDGKKVRFAKKSGELIDG